jgi:helix-turn-helix protein
VALECYRWEWRDLFASEHGPPDPSTRLVLFVLADLYMNQKGESAWPSQHTLAVRTGLSERSVRSHLKIAEKLGWLKIYLKTRPGKSWFSHEYVAVIPKRVAGLIKAKPWVEDRTYTQHPANSAGSSPTKDRHPANGAQDPATIAVHPANNDTTPGKIRHDTRQNLPTIFSENSPSNSPLNTPLNVQPQTAASWTVLKKVKAEKPKTAELSGESRLQSAKKLTLAAGIDAAVAQYRLTRDEADELSRECKHGHTKVVV